MKRVPVVPKSGATVRSLIRERLKETGRTSQELARAIELPEAYIEDVLSGDRRPPLPDRTDVYERTTRFLRMGRNELADCATVECKGARDVEAAPPAEVRNEMLSLCAPETARALRRRSGRAGEASLIDLFRRLLDVAQGYARRALTDQIPLRIAATRNGSDYPETRLRVLDFIEASPSTVTRADLAEFLKPKISSWDVDLDTGVLRVILRSAESTELHQRRPMTRSRRSRTGG